MAIDKTVASVADKIAQFYFEKNKMDYDKAIREIQDLQIRKIEIEDGECKECHQKVKELHVTLARIGKLIGVRGENIDKLTQYLDMKVKIFEAVDDVTDYMVRKLHDEEMPF